MAWFEDWFNSPYYHILYQNRNDEDAENFIETLLTHLELPAKSHVLDLPCGKGRHAIFLNKKGLNVIGADLATESIAAAKVSENNELKFLVHDMRDIIADEQFDCIFNLFTSFGYFDTFEENAKVLLSANHMLKSNGKMVIDFMNTDKMIDSLNPSETKTLDGIAFDLKKKVENGRIIKDIRFSDHSQQYHYQEKVAVLRKEDFEKYFAATGFEVINLFGNYSLAPFKKTTSDRMIFILKKK